MFLITHMGLWLSSVLVTHCHGSCGKREHAIYHIFFFFNHLKLCQTLMDFRQICHKPTSGLSDLKSHTTCYHCRMSTVQVPHHVTTQPHLPTTPHHHYNHKNSLPRIMWKDGKKKSPYTCLFLCSCFLFIVLNEMSPLVSFLVEHVRNYFQKEEHQPRISMRQHGLLMDLMSS